MKAVSDTHDLIQFVDQLKDWAKTHSAKALCSDLEDAERRGGTASELILQYGYALKKIQRNLPPQLPDHFRENIGRGIKVAEDAVALGAYT